MVDHFALLGPESAGAVGHQADILRVSDGRTEVRSGVFAEGAGFLLALGSVAGNDDVSDLDPGDSGTDTFDDGSGLVTDDDRPDGLSVEAVELIDVSVAECVGDDFDPHFSGLRRVDPDFFNDDGFFGFVGDGCFAQNRLRLLHDTRSEMLIIRYEVIVLI
jgi:hypothetical protein